MQQETLVQADAVLHMAGVRLNAMQCEEMKMTPAVLLMAAISSITHTPAQDAQQEGCS